MSGKIVFVTPKNAKWQCSACDYLCSLLTPYGSYAPKTCPLFFDFDAEWRQVT